jgi:glutamyl endopeptidase
MLLAQRLIPAIVVALAVVLLWTTLPERLVTAQKSGPHTMVGMDGTRRNAPVSGAVVEHGFAGSGLRELTAVNPVADPLQTFLIDGLDPKGDVIGADGRTRKTNTTTFPFRANVHLEVTFSATNGATCTGWMVGDRTIATAGHCVYDDVTNDWANSIIAYPGRDGSTMPYGSVNGCYWWSVDGWENDEKKKYDSGAIILASDDDVGNSTGSYGFRVDSNGDLDELKVRIFGYPGDKTYGTMWGMRKRIKNVDKKQLKHNLDTAGGQSGSAVYHNYGGSYQAVGIHAYGIYGTSDYNRATRITDNVFDNLKDWKDNPDCTP